MIDLDAFWAKTDRQRVPERWGRLTTHLSDAAGVAGRLWDEWLPEQARHIISTQLGVDPAVARKIAIWLAGAHDVGKASPAFSSKVPSLYLGSQREDGAPHGEVGFLAVYRALDRASYGGARLAEDGAAAVLGSVVAGHHGLYLPRGYFTKHVHHRQRGDRTAYQGYGLGQDWEAAQDQLVQRALGEAGLSVEEIPATIPLTVVPILTGLVVMADWVSSNVELFPLGSPGPLPSAERVDAGWCRMSLPKLNWQPQDLTALSPAEAFAARFGGQPRPAQAAVLDVLREHSAGRLVIVEDTTGSGKTEAALLAAEVLAQRTGAGGIWMALPSRASSDAMFGRVKQWLTSMMGDEAAAGLALAHAKAELNTDYVVAAAPTEASVHDGDDDECCGEGLHHWFEGRRERILAPAVVGTIDQLLWAGTQARHVGIRHLGMAGKVLVIDEVHSADATMLETLRQVLSWAGVYGIPVVALSATLTPSARRMLVEAYSSDSAAGEASTAAGFPSITVACPASAPGPLLVKDVAAAVSRTVQFAALPGLDVQAGLDQVVTSIGAGGIGVALYNTVARAQEAYQAAVDEWPHDQVLLVHSRFAAAHRRALEVQLESAVGKDGDRPARLLVIGTQVLEQSLDLDFDVMYTDVCPIDSLIQRAGRVHRHDRARPAGLDVPTVYVGGYDGDGQFERGAMFIYADGDEERASRLLGFTAELAAAGPLMQFPADAEGLLRRADAVLALPPARREGLFLPANTKVRHLAALKGTRIGVRDDGAESDEMVLAERGPDGELRVPQWVPGAGGIGLSDGDPLVLARAVIAVPRTWGVETVGPAHGWGRTVLRGIPVVVAWADEDGLAVWLPTAGRRVGYSQMEGLYRVP